MVSTFSFRLRLLTSAILGKWTSNDCSFFLSPPFPSFQSTEKSIHFFSLLSFTFYLGFPFGWGHTMASYCHVRWGAKWLYTFSLESRSVRLSDFTRLINWTEHSKDRKKILSSIPWVASTKSFSLSLSFSNSVSPSFGRMTNVKSTETDNRKDPFVYSD